MDKDMLREIFLLIIEIIKAFCEIVWMMIKGLFCLVWDRFFDLADASKELAAQQEWGVTGEDEWPGTPEIPAAAKEREPQKRAELPDAYGDNRIVLMVRDADWLFAYWELQKDVADSARNTLSSQAEGIKTLLRVYDVTDIIFNGGNAPKYFDIEVTGGARSWHIHTGEPNRSFCVDIGFLAPDGTFRVFSRSNTAKTPRIGVSDIVDEEWMGIDELYKMAYVPMGHSISESVFERTPARWQEALIEWASSSESLNSLTISKK